MNISPEAVAAETNFFFKIMGLLATAKDANDLEGIAEWIDELECMALHFDVAVLSRRSAIEAERASALLSDLQAKRLGYTGAMVMIRADEPANLN